MRVANVIRYSGLVFLGIGVLLFVQAIEKWISATEIANSADQVSTQGTVVRFVDERGLTRVPNDLTGDIATRTVVQFQDATGATFETRTKEAQIGSEYTFGDSVKVIYLKGKPATARVGTYEDLYRGPTFSSVASNFAFVIGLSFLGFERLVAHFNTKCKNKS